MINEHAPELREDPDQVAAATVGRVPLQIPVVSKNGTAAANDRPNRALEPGDPLVPLSGEAIPGVGRDAQDIKHNQFTFHLDADATACP